MCGAISTYNQDEPTGVRNTPNLIMQRGRMEGFLILDYVDRFLEAIMGLAPLVAEGKLQYAVEVVDGLEHAPDDAEPAVHRRPHRQADRARQRLAVAGESRDGVELTNLDQPLFDGADATKRDLVDYLDAVRATGSCPSSPTGRCRSFGCTVGRRRSCRRTSPSTRPTSSGRSTHWAESSKREVTYAVCDDRRTLLWFANQRAIEYHPAPHHRGATRGSSPT